MKLGDSGVLNLNFSHIVVGGRRGKHSDYIDISDYLLEIPYEYGDKIEAMTEAKMVVQHSKII